MILSRQPLTIPSLLKHALFPPHCLLCGDPGHMGLDICNACHQELPRITAHCERCGTPLEQTQPFCGCCLTHSPNFDDCISAYFYQQPLRWLIQQLKFRARLSTIPLLSRLLAETLADRISVRPDIIIPVPLHIHRLRERGFNQALELAKPLAKTYGIPLNNQLLKRNKNTSKQSGLSAKQRRANVNNAFALCADLNAQSIALVDDVITTGATANAIAKLLKQHGAQHVQVWALAHTVSGD